MTQWGEHRFVQAFPAEAIGHTQDAEVPAADDAVRDEVQRSALVRPLQYRHRRIRAQRPLSATTAALTGAGRAKAYHQALSNDSAQHGG